MMGPSQHTYILSQPSTLNLDQAYLIPVLHFCIMSCVDRQQRGGNGAALLGLLAALLLSIGAASTCRAQGISSIITSERFNEFLPRRNGAPADGFYTHDAFLEAAAAFPGFGTGQGKKHELAAFFAHVAHETGSKTCRIIILLPSVLLRIHVSLHVCDTRWGTHR